MISQSLKILILVNIAALLVIIFAWYLNVGQYNKCNVPFKVLGYTTITVGCKFESNYYCDVPILIGNATRKNGCRVYAT